jgi:flagellar hook-associated protein 2
MGTVGLSFGSPTSGKGFDVAATVSQIVANMRIVETAWKNQLTALQAQDTVLTQIGTDLGTLSTALASLTSLQGVLAEKQGSSSDTNVLQLTSATSSAVAGSHTIVVTQLAQTSSYVSDSIKNASDTLSGSFTINGQAVNIDSADNDTTLSSLVTAINSGNYGVTASIITDTSGSRLSLVSNTSGSAGAITVSGNFQDMNTGNSVAFSVGQTGQDATMTVDGIPVTSASNTVVGAIPGVTFQLLSAPPGTNVQVQITNDNSDVETAISNFVSAYNKVMGDLNGQEGNDSSGNPEPLFGSPTLTSLQQQLQSAILFNQSSGALTSLTQLGISVNNDGTLSLDGDTLDSVVSSNYKDVMNFFQPGSSSRSFGDNLTAVLDNLGNNSPDGSVFLVLKQNSSEEEDLNSNISKEETLISAQQAQLTAELNQANFVLSGIPQQIDNINQIFSAITGFNQNG